MEKKLDKLNRNLIQIPHDILSAVSTLQEQIKQYPSNENFIINCITYSSKYHKKKLKLIN